MSSFFMNNASPSLGKKRSFTETDDDKGKVPTKFDFQFTPTIQPHQSIFNVNMHPSTWNASSLTHRYQQKLKAKRLNSALAATLSTQQTTTTHRSAAASTTTVSATSNSIANYVYHRSLSSTLFGYIQLACSVIMLSMVSYILFQLLWTLQQDFQIKAHQHTTELIQEIQSCAHQYQINMCQPETRVPALEKKCEYWLACSNRIPSHVKKTKISAETLAEIFNSFFDTLSYKTMFFLVLLTTGYLVAFSISFRFFKSRYQHHDHQYRQDILDSSH